MFSASIYIIFMILLLIYVKLILFATRFELDNGYENLHCDIAVYELTFYKETIMNQPFYLFMQKKAATFLLYKSEKKTFVSFSPIQKVPFFYEFYSDRISVHFSTSNQRPFVLYLNTQILIKIDIFHRIFQTNI